MNQKEFELIAKVLKETKFVLSYEKVVNNMAYALGKAYPKTFDRDKFLKACGI